MQRFLILVCALLLNAPGLAASGTKTQVRLLLAQESARPGDAVMAAVELKMPPRTHTYWRNPGDSGQATEIAWTLPAGVTAGEIQWPVPEKFDFGGIITYGYHDAVVLLIPLKLGADLKPGPLEISAKVSWLECEEMCVPGDTIAKARLTIASESKPSADAPLIEAAAKKLPADGAALGASAKWDAAAVGDARPLLLEWKAAEAVASADFFPYVGDGFDVAATNTLVSAAAGKAGLRLQITKSGKDWPAQVSGLLIQKMASAASPQAFTITAKSGGAAASAAPATTAPSTTTDAKPRVEPGFPPLGLLLQMLGFAFLGGLILNIMPCVFPIISLKILGFVQQGRDDPRRVFHMGLIYALGVLASFAALAVLVIAAKSAGSGASWGSQMQSPVFTVVLTTVVVLVALNLFGVFEVTLGSGAMGAASNLAAKEGAAGAFFNGVLAVALATPCTAPAMATALGWAFTQPGPVVFATFLAIGLGLAAPYVLLSWKPGWLKLLPKPGAWMEHFKQAMGFPMLATAVWLLWFSTDHFGQRGVLWLGVFLVLVSLAAWTWGTFVQRGTKRRGLAGVISLVLLGAGYGWALEHELNWRNPAPPAAESGDIVETWPGGTVVRRWSPDAVAKARSEGRPVLVDFTAKWCLTCQANKASSIAVEDVEKKLKDLNAVVLIGDFTRKDPLIAEELRKHERAGVPLVLVYPRDATKPPLDLPALLTKGTVLDALDKAGK